MGLIHSMFGGGTSLQLSLDNDTASPGAVIGGRIVLGGGKKALRLAELTVKLFSVDVRAREGSAMPEIDLSEVAKQVVAGGIELAPKSENPFTFRLTVPYDVPLTAFHRTYKVVASADIPGVKDPSDDVKVTIVEASEDDERPLPFHEILERFPDLQSQEEGRLCKALYDFFLDCYSEGAQLMEAEPLVAHHMTHGTSVTVRREALKAWANLVDNRVQPQHLQTLYALANAPGLDEETFTEVVVAATKFAEEGALPLVQELARHPSPKVRADVSANLRFNAAEKFTGKRELLIQLAQDTSPEVRKGAVSALSDYIDEQGILQWLAQIAETDADSEVQAESLLSLQLAHHHGMLDFSLSVYERHLQNPNAQVRRQLPQCLGLMPPEALPRLGSIVQRLAQDPDEQVRDAMAFQFCNLTEMPQLLPIAHHMAQHDPSLDVRRQALGSMSGLMQPQQASAFYGQLLSQARSEDDLWPIVNGLRAHAEHADVKRLLTHMGQLPYPHIADAAREAMS